VLSSEAFSTVLLAANFTLIYPVSV